MLSVLPSLFVAVVTEHVMDVNLPFTSVLQSHPMELCTDCFGSRGECAVIADTLPKQKGGHSSQTEGKL